MKTSTALMCAQKNCASGAASLRQRLRERARDEAWEYPRVWMEALEARRMLSAATATVHLDANFGNGGYATGRLPARGHPVSAEITAIAAASDGGIYAAGSIDYLDGNNVARPSGFGLARFNANGMPDEAFGTHGAVALYGLSDFIYVEGLLAQPDGKVLIALDHFLAGQEAPYTDEGIVLLRLNRDGTPDDSFGTAGQVTMAGWSASSGPINGASIWLQNDGKIMMLRSQNSSSEPYHLRFVTLRMNSDGTPDESFGPNGEYVSGPIDTLGFRNVSGESLLGAVPLPSGGSVAYATVEQSIMRRNSDGGEDMIATSSLVQFHFDDRGHVVSNRTVANDLYQLTIAPDGGAIVFAGSPNLIILRLRADGTPDPAFGNHGAIDSGYIFDARVLPDGKIMTFVEFGDDANFQIAMQRLDATGAVDPHFGGGQPVFGLRPVMQDSSDNFEPASIVLGDGSMILALQPVAGSLNFRLAKIQPDGGTLDATPQNPDATGGDVISSDDPTAGFGVLVESGTSAPVADGRGLFGDIASVTTWNPKGKRDLFYSGTGDE